MQTYKIEQLYYKAIPTHIYPTQMYVRISILHIYIIYPFILSGFKIQPFPLIFPEIVSPLGGWSQDGTMLGWSTFIPYTGNGVSRSLVVRQRLVVVKAFCQLFCSACSYLLMPFFVKLGYVMSIVLQLTTHSQGWGEKPQEGQTWRQTFPNLKK